MHNAAHATKPHLFLLRLTARHLHTQPCQPTRHSLQPPVSHRLRFNLIASVARSQWLSQWLRPTLRCRLRVVVVARLPAVHQHQAAAQILAVRLRNLVSVSAVQPRKQSEKQLSVVTLAVANTSNDLRSL